VLVDLVQATVNAKQIFTLLDGGLPVEELTVDMVDLKIFYFSLWQDRILQQLCAVAFVRSLFEFGDCNLICVNESDLLTVLVPISNFGTKLNLLVDCDFSLDLITCLELGLESFLV